MFCAKHVNFYHIKPHHTNHVSLEQARIDVAGSGAKVPLNSKVFSSAARSTSGSFRDNSKKHFGSFCKKSLLVGARFPLLCGWTRQYAIGPQSVSMHQRWGARTVIHGLILKDNDHWTHDLVPSPRMEKLSF